MTESAKSDLCEDLVSLYLRSQPSHRKRLKTAENKGFLTFLNAMGRSVPLKTPIRFQIANKINGFVHVSYGTALKKIDIRRRSGSQNDMALKRAAVQKVTVGESEDQLHAGNLQTGTEAGTEGDRR